MATAFNPAAARGVSTAPVPSTRSRQRVFYTGMSLAIVATVFVGFAPTYYLKTVYGTPALSPLLHVHGFLFSLWLLLLIVQPALVAVRRVDVHRKLGTVGGVVAAAMVPMAYAAAMDAARRGAAPPGLSALSFLAIPLATVVVFPVLIGAALYWRRYAETHKRLMLMGTLELLPAGVARWPAIAPLGPLAYFGISDLFVVAMVVFDLKTRGRVHPATIWGGLFLIASQVGRVVISGTQPWLSFAGWLAG